MLNENPIDLLNICAIQDNCSAIIEFDEAGFAYTEIFLQYGGKIQMKQRMNRSVTKSVSSLISEGNRFSAGQPAKEAKKPTLFEINEHRSFSLLQAETTTMPAAKKKTFSSSSSSSCP